MEPRNGQNGVCKPSCSHFRNNKLPFHVLQCKGVLQLWSHLWRKILTTLWKRDDDITSQKPSVQDLSMASTSLPKSRTAAVRMAMRSVYTIDFLQMWMGCPSHIFHQKHRFKHKTKYLEVLQDQNTSGPQSLNTIKPVFLNLWTIYM